MAHLIQTKLDRTDPAFLYLDLHEDEDILMVIRHHWAGFLGTLGIVVSIGSVPLLFIIYVYCKKDFSSFLLRFRLTTQPIPDKVNLRPVDSLPLRWLGLVE